MYQKKKVAVIVVAAGSGTRMGGSVPKQFLEIGGIPVLTRAVTAFFQHPFVDDIFIITRSEYKAYCEQEILEPYGLKVTGILAGGTERQDSVGKGLDGLSPDTELVLIHDGARPFVSQQIITDSVKEAANHQAAVVAVPVKDTIKRCELDVFVDTPRRQGLYQVQTPQSFSVQLLKRAFAQARQDKFLGTDDSILVERLDQKVYLVKGDYQNIKITTADDLILGEAIAENGGGTSMKSRVGMGYDVHRLTEDRKLILGGVEIPYEKGLLGHSDADVLLHALMDALLGAAGLGDIGRHFPDSDPTYRGISSLKLLACVKDLLEKKRVEIGNVDCTVIAQQPKIAAFIPEMQRRIAETLSISDTQINIKGTTTEKLGFCGRGEGIAAEAIAMVYMK